MVQGRETRVIGSESLNFAVIPINVRIFLVVVAMSGGVDSSVAAMLLAQKVLHIYPSGQV